MDILPTFIKVLVWILFSQHHLPLTKVSEFAMCVTVASERTKVEPEILVALITRESGWNETARSKTHDYGLGQIHYKGKGRSKEPDKQEYQTLMTGCSNINLVADFIRTYGVKGYNPGSTGYVERTRAKAMKLKRTF